MSDEPARIWATEDRKNYGEDRFHATSPMTGLTEYVRADLSDALLREAMEALGKLHHAVCGETGFAQCVRDDSKTLYPWPALDDADEIARATLAKLRAHLGEDK